MLKLTADYKWTYYRVVEGLYSILPPEKIRSRCGVNYAQKIFPDLEEELQGLGVATENYPRFHCNSEEQVTRVVALLNRKWSKKLTEEIKKKNEI